MIGPLQPMIKSLLAFFEGGPGRFQADESQQKALQVLEDFVLGDQERGVQVLQGPAGSGKTFMMRALVQWMQALDRPVVLLAPTGRAAKVLARATRLRANTLHRQLYRPVEENAGPTRGLRVRFELKAMERDEPCVFVVDEASMMGNGSGGGEALIRDLLQQIYDSSSWHKIILVGDPYQLPPVGEIDSPAFRAETWVPWGCRFGQIHLEGRYRQGADSPVLELAGRILEWMQDARQGGTTAWWDEFSNWASEYAMGGTDEDPRWLPGLGPAVKDFHRYYEAGQTVFLAYSNAWVSRFNNCYRTLAQRRSGSRPQEGETLLVVRNQYLAGGHMLANGEEVRLLRRVGRAHRHAGLMWSNAVLEWTGLDGEARDFESKICLDLLESSQPGLNPVQQHAIWQARSMDGELERDPYMQALWVKYPYAQTVHKAQGGAWARVYLLLEKPYSVRDSMAYLRWLYTAVTRCSDQLVLVQAKS